MTIRTTYDTDYTPYLTTKNVVSDGSKSSGAVFLEKAFKVFALIIAVNFLFFE